MKPTPRFLLAVCSWILISQLACAAVSVENVRGVQRAGTKLVDVYYDVTGTDKSVTVTLEVSSDGGSTWTVPATSLSGHVGSGVNAGRNRRIVWNAGSDWTGQYSAQIRYRIQAVEDAEGGPVPEGFATIPAGNFVMGDTFAEGGSNELPTRMVYVSAFAMQKTEVTKAQWDTVRTWGSTHGYTDLRVGGVKGTNHPVHTVSWYDVVKWCNARSEMEGKPVVYTVGGAAYKTGESTPMTDYAAKGYRLPTEAEWEKAARGSLAGKRFPWGDTIDHSNANYGANGSAYTYDVSPYTSHTLHPDWDDGSYSCTSPVGSFAANGYGLFDMSGNLWEWCNDWYDPSYYGSSGNTSDPKGPATGFERAPGMGSERVNRGGGWYDIALSERCTGRNGGHPLGANDELGFRPVLGQ